MMISTIIIIVRNIREDICNDSTRALRQPITDNMTMSGEIPPSQRGKLYSISNVYNSAIISSTAAVDRILDDVNNVLPISMAYDDICELLVKAYVHVFARSRHGPRA